MSKKPKKPAKRVTTKPNASPSSQLTPPPVTRKLDLACGQTPKEGCEGVDLFAPQALYKVDLSVYPWPFEDNSVAEIYCSHYIEHIIDDVIDERGDRCKPGTPGAKDALFKFFDECYRILIPGGALDIICPAARSERGFQDPTHRRFIVSNTFMYMWAEWRVFNKLDHYAVDCDFGCMMLSYSTSAELQAKHPDASTQPINHFWNTIYDYVVKLQAFKPNRMIELAARERVRQAAQAQPQEASPAAS